MGELVGHHRADPTGGGKVGRQRPQRFALAVESVFRGTPVGKPSMSEISGELVDQKLIELLKAGNVQKWTEAESAHVLHAAFHGSLLVSAARSAEVGGHRQRAVKRLEDLVFDPLGAMPDLAYRERCVIEHHATGQAPEVEERGDDRVEQALQSLHRIGLGEVGIAAGQRRHQELHLLLTAGDDGPALAEVDLHGLAREVGAVHERLGAIDVLAHLRHELAEGALGEVEVEARPQELADPLGGEPRFLA